MTPTMYCPEDGSPIKVRGNAPAGERICPEHGVPLLDHLPGNPPKRKGLTRSTRKQESAAERRARLRFNSVVCERPCFFLDRTPDGKPRREGHTCRYPLDAHHLISKQWIRRELGDLPDDELIAVVWNPIIGVPLCRKAHDAVEFGTGSQDTIFRHELEPELILFCERFDSEHPGSRSLLLQLHEESPIKEGTTDG